MNILVHNKRNVVFQIPDLDAQLDRYTEEDGIVVSFSLPQPCIVLHNERETTGADLADQATLQPVRRP
ncbi:MAG: hypothetical protein P4M11_14915 [Candidatus Pacebacteria bacterium]|nr:hypothetical protein [Candidatus Paceibacterota bacterium]